MPHRDVVTILVEILVHSAHPGVHVPVGVHYIVAADEARRGTAHHWRAIDNAELRHYREDEVVQRRDV